MRVAERIRDQSALIKQFPDTSSGAIPADDEESDEGYARTSEHDKKYSLHSRLQSQGLGLSHPIAARVLFPYSSISAATTRSLAKMMSARFPLRAASRRRADILTGS